MNNEGERPQSDKGNILPGSSESPKEVGPKEACTKAHHYYISKMKEKDRILKAAREKETVTYAGVPIDYQLISQKKPCRQEGTGKKYSKS